MPLALDLDLVLFAKWRLRIAELDLRIFQRECDVELRLIILLYLNQSPLERTALLSQFKLDRITMRTRIAALIERNLVSEVANPADKRKKRYSLTKRGVALLQDYKSEVTKLTLVTE